MAIQRVLLLTLGGMFANTVWKQVRLWADTRSTNRQDEWSSDDWPGETRQQVDGFVMKLMRAAHTPPVLYRSEYVDLWSMGDVYETALVKQHPDVCRQLLTESHQLIVTWVRFSEQIVPDDDEPDETHWLYNRCNEAMAAWPGISEERLVILVRSVLGGLWTDEEVANSLEAIPKWWTAE